MNIIDTLKERAIEYFEEEDGVLRIGKYDHGLVETLIQETLSDFAQYLKEVVGERKLDAELHYDIRGMERTKGYAEASDDITNELDNYLV